jgi:parvulin-like peptidyl-prolyl isomerase
MKISLLDAAAALLTSLVLSVALFGQTRLSSGACINHFGQKEWEILLETAPAETKTRFLEDTETRKRQIEDLRHLLAYGCEAVRTGLHLEKTNAVELKNIKSETIAVAYDREVSKGSPGFPFERITPSQIEKFYSLPTNVSAFDEFLTAKIELLKKTGSPLAGRGPTDEEKQQAREFFAKIKISEAEYLRRPAVAMKVGARVGLQTRLQQARFLGMLVMEKISASVAVTDAEIDAYIAGHPELDVSRKRELATKLLERAKTGEDLAALANQYTEDPGNNGANGAKRGGLYSGIRKGVFVPPFENAALSLEAGKLYPSLVESDFGYHIIKLEKVSGTGDDLQYDVRHVLISTGFKDRDDPSGREMPAREFVRSKLEKEKERAATNKIVAANRVTVEDYDPARRPAARRSPVKRRR